jgi:serine O-acetyltransferase
MMRPEFIQHLFDAHRHCPECPSSEEISGFFKEMLGILFPDFASRKYQESSELMAHVNEVREMLNQLLVRSQHQQTQEYLHGVSGQFFDELPLLRERLLKDVNAMFEGDPAARNRHEVIRTYPGFYAIAAYRMAHSLHRLAVEGLPRAITEHAHSLTGIDIHPGASVGEHFCIDHGTGIVIGETSIIGNHVKVYQGVTLGALSVDKQDALTKRHPTIEDHVVIYSGATILGGETVVGHNSVIGGNVWLTRSVPPHSKVYYYPSVKGDRADEMAIKS